MTLSESATQTRQTRVAWTGMLSVLLTPFQDDGGLDRARFEWLVNQSLTDGVDGLIVCGSTGEFNALSNAERVELFDIAAQMARGRVPLIAGIAALDPRDTTHLAEEAASLGFDGALVLPPIYAMPNPREIRAYYEGLADSLALRIVLYNGPRRTGVNLNLEIVASLADHPNIVGIKDSSGSIVHLGSLIQVVGDRLRVYTGHETMLLPAMTLGADGAVSMISQILGPLARRFWAAVSSGDLIVARELERTVYKVYQTFEIGNYYSAMKEDMALLGRPVGPPRRPLLPVTLEERARIRALLIEAGLLGA